MREFRFRAWYKPKGKMYTQSLESINFETKVMSVYTDSDGYRQLRLSDFELMQYTGLKDKHGKVIYEGDVLKDEFGLGEVKWVQEHCSFVVYAPEKGYYFLESGDGELLISTEVIGNIYENPEWEF